MLKVKNNQLYFDGQGLVSLTQKLKTPFFLFSQNELENNYRRFHTSFSSAYSNIRVDYSVKTNCELGVLKILKRLGNSLEIASGHELFVAKKAGFSGHQAIFDGPCKTNQDIEFALKERIHAFYADSFQDAVYINQLAKKLNQKTNLVFRVNLGLKDVLSGIAEKAIGKFGLPESDVVKTIALSRKLSRLNFIGLSTHLGSQQLSPKPYLIAIDKLIDLASTLEKKGHLINELNLGGGYPSQTLSKITLPGLLLSALGVSLKKTVPSIEVFGHKISQRINQQIDHLESKPVFAFQPGRSISSSIGIAVSKIKVIKNRWAFLDISTSSLPESLFFAQRQIIIANRLKDKKTQKINIAGSGLNTADNFAYNIKLPNLSVGDIAIILDAGAYSISRANRFTILNPPVYLINKQGQIEKIRRNEIYEDITAPMGE